MLISYVRRLSWICLGTVITESSDLAAVELAAPKCSPVWVVEAPHSY